jgi:MoxR-like ATPase
MSEPKSLEDYADDERLAQLQQRLSDPSHYHASDELSSAVRVSLMLGMPLLVTGKPGTGKTQLASRVAHDLKLPTDKYPLTFHTKSTSTARDLFYNYDALRHFRDSQFEGRGIDADPYVSYEALGLAIILSLPSDHPHRKKLKQYIPEDLRDEPPRRTVVLIDEIDKAPRDFPNDLLNEIEAMSFTVKEVKDIDGTKQDLTINADARYRPVVIITSNSERDLPDAFLRRCVFYHIPTPDEEQLRAIVAGRLRPGPEFTQQMRDRAVKHFLELCALPGLEKPPATAELLVWMRVLELENLDVTDGTRREDLKRTYVTLGKNDRDLKVMKEALDSASRPSAEHDEG